MLSRPADTPANRLSRWADIVKLSAEFAQAAGVAAREIVDELNVPDAKKKHKPLQVGGLAGGVKYSSNGSVICLYILIQHYVTRRRS